MLKLQLLIRTSCCNYSQYKTTVHLPQTAFPLNVKNKAKHEDELQQVTLNIFKLVILTKNVK